MLDISEAWAAGAWVDSEVYEEPTARVVTMGGNRQLQALAEVLGRLKCLHESVHATPEPSHEQAMPQGLVAALPEQLNDSLGEISHSQRNNGNHYSWTIGLAGAILKRLLAKSKLRRRRTF